MIVSLAIIILLQAVARHGYGKSAYLANPCTEEKLTLGYQYHAYPFNPAMYVQCSQWGIPYLRTCPAESFWHSKMMVCVNAASGIPVGIDAESEEKKDLSASAEVILARPEVGGSTREEEYGNSNANSDVNDEKESLMNGNSNRYNNRFINTNRNGVVSVNTFGFSNDDNAMKGNINGPISSTESYRNGVNMNINDGDTGDNEQESNNEEAVMNGNGSISSLPNDRRPMNEHNSNSSNGKRQLAGVDIGNSNVKTDVKSTDDNMAAGRGGINGDVVGETEGQMTERMDMEINVNGDSYGYKKMENDKGPRSMEQIDSSDSRGEIDDLYGDGFWAFKKSWNWLGYYPRRNLADETGDGLSPGGTNGNNDENGREQAAIGNSRNNNDNNKDVDKNSIIGNPVTRSSEDGMKSGATFYQGINPCLSSKLRNHPFPGVPGKYLECHGWHEPPKVKSCSFGAVWVQEYQMCKIEVLPSKATTTAPITTTSAPYTIDPDMCVGASRYHLAHPHDRSKYIQCDQYGNIYIRNCGDNKIWDEFYHACVGRNDITQNEAGVEENSQNETVKTDDVEGNENFLVDTQQEETDDTEKSGHNTTEKSTTAEAHPNIYTDSDVTDGVTNLEEDSNTVVQVDGAEDDGDNESAETAGMESRVVTGKNINSFVKYPYKFYRNSWKAWW